jgi:hypothetical protein
MRTPMSILKGLEAKYPRVWKAAEKIRRERGRRMPNWPDWCYMPMGAWFAVANAAGWQPTERPVIDVPTMAALGAWRHGKGVYRFEPEIFEMVYNTPPLGNIPTDLLLRLPEWSLYVELPPGAAGYYGYKLNGFFAYLECDLDKNNIMELRLLLNPESGPLGTIHVTLGDITLEESFNSFFAKYIQQIERWPEIALATGGVIPPSDAAESMAREVRGLVSLALYLCCDEPDVIVLRRPARQLRRSAVKLIESRGGTPEAPDITIWQVGAKLAREIQAAEEVWEKEEAAKAPGERRRPRPHFRRGHWHPYWTGPKKPPADGVDAPPQVLALRFLRPQLVAGGPDAE